MNPEKIKVLLVEDNPADILLLVAAFQEFGNGKFELTQANDFDFALKRIHGEKFDAILLDLSLPLFLGLEPLIRIHRIRPKIPIIVFSGYNDPQLASEAVRMGALNYINKNNLNGADLVQILLTAVGNGKKPSINETKPT